MKHRIAERLRRLADRIDHAGAPKVTGWSFTFELHEGIRFRDDGKGCQVAYLGDAEYGKAHAQSDSHAPPTDWAALCGWRAARR